MWYIPKKLRFLFRGFGFFFLAILCKVDQASVFFFFFMIITITNLLDSLKAFSFLIFFSAKNVGLAAFCFDSFRLRCLW